MNYNLALRIVKSESAEMTAERIVELYEVIVEYDEKCHALIKAVEDENIIERDNIIELIKREFKALK